MRSVSSQLVVALGVCLSGCGDSDGSDGTLTVTPARGGTVTSADGRLTLDIPADAVAERVDVSVTVVAEADAPEDAFPAGVAYDLQPSGLEFAVPATMRFEFGRDEMAAAGSTFENAPVGSAGTDWFFPVFLASAPEDGTAEPLAEQVLDTTPEGDDLVVEGSLEHFSLGWAQKDNIYFKVQPIVLDVFQTTTARISIDAYMGHRNVSVASAVVYAQPAGPLDVALASTTFPVSVNMGFTSGIDVVATCNEAGDGIWVAALTGRLWEPASAYSLPDAPLDLVLAAPYECRLPPGCANPMTVRHEGEPVDAPSLPVVAVGSSGTAQTCGSVVNGGAQEVNDETTMLGEIAVAVLRATEAATLEISVSWSAGFRDVGPDFDFFIAETTIADPWYVPSADILARFNGVNNPEVGTFPTQAKDYLLIVHNYEDGAGTFTLDITASPP